MGDDEVEREIEDLRRRNAPLIEEPHGTAAALGHILTVDFVGRIDGVPFEGGSGRDVELEIGSGRFIPGFEDQLVGRCRGRGPRGHDDVPGAATARPISPGKTAVFAVHVAEVKRRELPALDDEFAKDLGEFDTLGALRDRIHDDLRESREQAARAALRRSVLERARGAHRVRGAARRGRRASSSGGCAWPCSSSTLACRTTCCTRRSSAGARNGGRRPSAR